ncbi:MAG: hypothetical protein KA604_02545 [Candidatus Saccharimonas sp.]|nr:hypothetical protein [Candidatus Saccharimonas sp.]
MTRSRNHAPRTGNRLMKGVAVIGLASVALTACGSSADDLEAMKQHIRGLACEVAKGAADSSGNVHPSVSGSITLSREDLKNGWGTSIDKTLSLEVDGINDGQPVSARQVCTLIDTGDFYLRDNNDPDDKKVDEGHTQVIAIIGGRPESAEFGTGRFGGPDNTAVLQADTARVERAVQLVLNKPDK